MRANRWILKWLWDTMKQIIGETYLVDKVGVDMNLVCGRFSSSHRPRWVNGLDLLVQLSELDISEDVISVTPGQSQFVQQSSHLSRFQLRSCQGLKIILVLTWYNYC